MPNISKRVVARRTSYADRFFLTGAAVLVGIALYVVAPFAYAEKAAEKLVAGYRLSFNIAATGAVPRQPEGHSQSMHHAPSLSEATQHLVLTITNATSGERIADAYVVMHVVPRSNAKEQEIDLDAMQWNGDVAYGSYFLAPRRQRQWLLFSIHRKSTSEVIESYIEYPFPQQVHQPAAPADLGDSR